MNNKTNENKFISYIKSEEFKKWFMPMLLMGILSVGLMIITFIYSTANFDKVLFKSFLTGKRLLILNFIPIFILMLILALLTNRVWLGYLISGIAFFAMSVINKYKLIYRDEPLKFVDIKLVTESMDMAGKYEINLDIPMIITVIAIVSISILIKKKFKYNSFEKNSRKVFAVLTLAVCILIPKTFYFNKDIYEIVGNKDLINPWSETQQFQSKGLVYPFLFSATELKDRVLEDYDEERAIEILDQYEYELIPDDKKVNIVSIMLEAYNDFSKFEDVDLNIDVYEEFHKIQEESISGNLITNVFGGGTINTEWSYLIGLNSHPPKYVKDSNSNVWYFKDNGYKTESMHPNYGWFYNRRNVNEFIGFESFDYYENKYEAIQEDFLDDYEFFDYIIEGYEKSIEEDKPYFHFSVTYQNHGPYSDQKEVEEEYLVRKSNYDEKTYNIINNYLKGINETDKALRKLVDYFENQDEPVVLVFFGDHNPWLGDENKGYKMLNIDMGLEDEESFKNYYTTPYVFWANDKAKEVLDNDFNKQGEEISPNFLMTELFENLNYTGDEYMQYSKDLKNNYFTVNNDMFFRQPDGTYTRQLEGEKYKVWREFNSVQYYHGRNFKYEYLK